MNNADDLQKAQEYLEEQVYFPDETCLKQNEVSRELKKAFLAGRTSLREEFLKVGVEGVREFEIENCHNTVTVKSLRVNGKMSWVKLNEIFNVVEKLPVAAKLQAQEEKIKELENKLLTFEGMTFSENEHILKLEAENRKLNELVQQWVSAYDKLLDKYEPRTLSETEKK